MEIGITYNEKQTQEAHGSQAIERNTDFSKPKELKNAVKTLFKSFTCPECGGHIIKGDGVTTDFGKVKFFQEEYKKGFFRKRFVSKHTKNVYRIHHIYLKSSGFLSPAGYLHCKSCQWKIKGNKSSSTQWLSINDIMNGKM